MQAPMEIMKRLRSLADATRSHVKLAIVLFFLFAVFTSLARAQESPYIVTYDHYLEEPGSLEVNTFPPSARSGEATTFTPSGASSNTELPHGGLLNFTST